MGSNSWTDADSSSESSQSDDASSSTKQHKRLEPEEQATVDLIAAFQLVARRGSGVEAWASPFRDHPIAFLLDSMSDAANLWDAQGQLLYGNRAARALGIGSAEETAIQEISAHGKRFERRCLRCHNEQFEYVLEVVREVVPGAP